MAQPQFDMSLSELVTIEGPPTRGPVPRWQRRVSIDANPQCLSPMPRKCRLSSSHLSPAMQRKNRLSSSHLSPAMQIKRRLSSSCLSPAMPRKSRIASRSSPFASPSVNKRPSLLCVRTPGRSRRLKSAKTPGKTPKKGATPKKPNKSPLDPHKNQGDRFIPSRAQTDYDLSHFIVTQDGQKENEEQEKQDAGNYNNAIADSLSLPHPAQKESKILSFKQKAPRAEGFNNRNKVLYSSSATKLKVKSKRFIPQTPEKILDAPDLRDDFYLTLIDWGSKNLLAVALQDEVYLWNANSSEIQNLMNVSSPEEYVTCVSWIDEGNILAVANSLGHVQLWDVATAKCLRNMVGHSSRVGVLSWNSYILTSGSKSGVIHHHDVRVPEHHVGTLDHHDQAVCGLEWSPDGSYLASGGNDNILNIWDASATTGSEPVYSITQHQAAVKAISWCPWQTQLLASGGGAADRTIKLWSASTGMCLKTADAGSQVSALVWSPEHKELASGHGYSQNQITLWKYPMMEKIAHLHGHTSRILNMTLSPDKSMIVSAGADETLRFWNCFAKDTAKKQATTKVRKSSVTSLTARTIR